MKAEILENGRIKLTAENVAEKVLLTQIVDEHCDEDIGKYFFVSGNIEKPVHELYTKNNTPLLPDTWKIGNGVNWWDFGGVK